VVYADRFTPQAEKRAGAPRMQGRFLSSNALPSSMSRNARAGRRAGKDLFGDPAPLPEREIVPLAEKSSPHRAFPFASAGQGLLCPFRRLCQVAATGLL
jgi:hypothetical protein